MVKIYVSVKILLDWWITNMTKGQDKMIHWNEELYFTIVTSNSSVDDKSDMYSLNE